MRRAALMLVALALSAVPVAAAAAKCPKTTLPDLEDEVMCLECKEPLNESVDAPQAQRERALIQSLIAQCKSKSQIKAILVQQFGERVLAQPPAKGFNLTAYIVPALAVVAALAVIGVATVRWRRRQLAAPATPAPSGAESSRLDADLDRYEL